MGKTIAVTQLSEKLHLAECTDGFWLYDETRGMNLAMKAKTDVAALVDALKYYQVRLSSVESDYKQLKSKVDQFVSQFEEDED